MNKLELRVGFVPRVCDGFKSLCWEMASFTESLRSCNVFLEIPRISDKETEFSFLF